MKKFIVLIIVMIILDLKNIGSFKIWDVLGINIENINLEMWSALIITLVFYKFEVKRENDLLNAEEREKHNKNLYKAREFNLDNYQNQKKYPLCQVADSLQDEFEIKNDLYKQYIVIEPEVKKQILELTNCKKIESLSMEVIKENLNKFKKDTKKINLGECMFYDGFKFLHKAQQYFEKQLPLKKRYIYDNPRPTRAFGDGKVDVYNLIDDFVENELKESKDQKEVDNPYKIVEKMCKDINKDDSEVCFYVMEVINNTIYAFKNNELLKEHKTYRGTKFGKVSIDELENFEDYYYFTLLNIYEAYNNI